MKRRDFILTAAVGSAALGSGNLFGFPEPYIKGKNVGKFCFQSERKIPAARTSLIGASPWPTRYPRLCSDSPELSSESMQ